MRAAITLYLTRWKLPNQYGAYDLQQDFLTEADWEDLIRWQKILIPFRELCEQEEGRAQAAGREGQYGTLWRVLHGMNFMYNILEKAQKEVNTPGTDVERTEHYNTGINTAWLKLEKYFKLTDSSPLYVAAIVLHPARRFEYFEDKWAKHPTWIKNVKKVFKDLFTSYCEKVTNINSAYDPDESQPKNVKSAYLEFDEFSVDYLSRRYQKQKKKDTDNLELDTYLRSFDHRLRSIKDPLEWWKTHQTDYPILARMAFDIFSIPAMSSEVERVFSAAKKLITDERNCLGAEAVEACETQRYWLKLDLVD